MAVKTKAQLATDISTLLADNTSGDISEADLRQISQDIVDSLQNQTEADALYSVLGHGHTAAEISGTEIFTPAEKTKLAGLDDEHYKGLYASLSALQTAHATANPGDYAYVDPGVGSDVELYLWDNDDAAWVQGGGSGTETPASVLSKLLANPDTNVVSDQQKAAIGDPLADLAALTLLPIATLVANERRHVIALNADFFWRPGAASGNAEPDDKSNPGVDPGYWVNANLIGTDFASYILANLITALDAADAVMVATAAGERGITKANLRTQVAPSINRYAGNHQLAAADAHSIAVLESGAATVLSIAPSSTLALPIDVIFGFEQGGAGPMTIDVPAGVTLNGVDNGTLTVDGRYKGGSLRQDTTDNWIATGAVS